MWVSLCGVKKYTPPDSISPYSLYSLCTLYCCACTLTRDSIGNYRFILNLNSEDIRMQWLKLMKILHLHTWLLIFCSTQCMLTIRNVTIMYLYSTRVLCTLCTLYSTLMLHYVHVEAPWLPYTTSWTFTQIRLCRQALCPYNMPNTTHLDFTSELILFKFHNNLSKVVVYVYLSITKQNGLTLSA